ncbi:kinase [Oceanobacillus sp. CAU 1775]
MQSTLIILRGNSGSGKSTIAKRLQSHLGHGTLVVSQDVVRRDMLRVQDREGNLSIELIQQIASYGKGKCEFVIVEGILYKERYGEMLRDLIRYFDDEVFAYYFDLPFEETVHRHQSREKNMEFGEESLRAWWNEKDYLGVDNEFFLTKNMTEDDIFNLILNDVKGNEANGA